MHSSSKSMLMQSEVGILALAAASIEKNVWEVRTNVRFLLIIFQGIKEFSASI